jgi:hypothetical protein
MKLFDFLDRQMVSRIAQPVVDFFEIQPHVMGRRILLALLLMHLCRCVLTGWAPMQFALAAVIGYMLTLPRGACHYAALCKLRFTYILRGIGVVTVLIGAFVAPGMSVLTDVTFLAYLVFGLCRPPKPRPPAVWRAATEDAR